MSICADDFNEVGDTPIVCMEDRLRALGILDSKDDLTSDTVIDSTKLRGIDIEANLPQRKVRFLVWWDLVILLNCCSCVSFQLFSLFFHYFPVMIFVYESCMCSNSSDRLIAISDEGSYFIHGS